MGRVGQARGTREATKTNKEAGAADGKAAASLSRRVQPTAASVQQKSASSLPTSVNADEQLKESVAFFVRGSSSQEEAAESVENEGKRDGGDLCPSPSAQRKRASLRAARFRGSARRLEATEARDAADETDAVIGGDSDVFSEPPTEDPVGATLEEAFGGNDEPERESGERCSGRGTETRLDGITQAEEGDGTAVTRRARRRNLKASTVDAAAGEADATGTSSLPEDSEECAADTAAVDEEMANRYLALAFPELAAEYAAAGDGANAIPVNDVMTDSAVVAAWRCVKCDHVWRSGVFVRCILKNGCPQCTANRTSTLAKARPDLLQLWDYNRNNPFLKPEEIAADSKESVFWNCPMCRESYAARVKDRALDKVRCPSCALLRSQSAGVLAAEESVVLQEWHPLKNGDLHIEQLSPTDTKTKVWWLCAGCGHEWEASLAARLARWRRSRRSLCPVCHGKGVTDLVQ
ncbi:conserved hypothetical protein [Leishmania major strain Friedlin]|uniref:Treble clef zinc finger domain-containing protein n=1 Tax=Leishmania major TaxID=5664 RepID=E9AE80_LEIMA|nr:conserved hypothetical protein [Leishmania major strain Friedlin]CAG9577959.1 Domain_of_unknown_function_(DUF4379)_-_putative [Leishmania major strain Friedlin]CBZ12559.1 conserved hypothetical protein [Leishmania major strain Friedlin]|eukprot:XP_003722301.1 conserved hypothetical protein [Leishmania major strain Friedlin]